MDYSQFMGEQVPGILLPYEVPPTESGYGDFGVRQL